jgi:hypothetical protein
LNSNPAKITDAQVRAVLRSASEETTARMLADKTNSTVDAAQARLNQMVVDGKLDVFTPADALESHYRPASRLLEEQSR